MDWSIQQIAKHAGTTSRALRHYDDVGLLPPTRIGDNGYRYYDELALVRLQRILLLRDLGLGIPAIADVLAGSADDQAALTTHLALLREERDRLDRQIAAVELTIDTMEGGEQLMAESMFDGFDHTQYREEVEQRWGTKTYADSDRWWRSKSADEKTEWQRAQTQLAADWADAAAQGLDPRSDAAQALARRHYDWLTGIPGTPQTEHGLPLPAYLTGLAEMYVADPRFAANYGGEQGATFVRDAILAFAETL